MCAKIFQLHFSKLTFICDYLMHYYYGTARLKRGRVDVPILSAGPPPALEVGRA